MKFLPYHLEEPRPAAIKPAGHALTPELLTTFPELIRQLEQELMDIYKLLKNKKMNMLSKFSASLQTLLQRYPIDLLADYIHSHHQHRQFRR